uniref:SURF1-like protein n=3 Tax=Lygus hesperus TaxID=30085 RepID=A0A0K8SFG3_LYGHE
MLCVRKLVSAIPSRVILPARPTICRGDKRLKSQTANNFAASKRTAPFQRPDLRNLNKKEDSGVGAYFLLVIPVSAFCLGCWQIERKKWKEDLIEKLSMKTNATAVPLPTELNEVKELEFRRVHVKGRFDHSGEQYLGPRSCLSEGESTYGGKLMSTAANNSSGYLVVTPFILSNTGERILVNRGWVPFPKKKPSTRPDGQISGEVELEGIVRLTEPRPQFGPANKTDVGIWFHRDVEGMAELVDCSPIFLDACAESTVPGGPIGGQTRASLRNEHLSYILTWFSLSGATAYMWYMKYVRKV